MKSLRQTVPLLCSFAALALVIVMTPTLLAAGPPRPPDPSPDLVRELARLDTVYRHGTEAKFAELEREADRLQREYPAQDDRARILAQVAHVAAQSDIRRQVERVRKYGRLALAISRDPVQRGTLASYLGSAAEVDSGEKDFTARRRNAARELLAGYAALVALDLPAKAPELPGVGRFDIDGDPAAVAQAQAFHAAQVEARRQAEFVRDLVERRDTLAGQLRWLYHPDPRVHGRNPEGPDELKALATGVLKDPGEVRMLLERVTSK